MIDRPSIILSQERLTNTLIPTANAIVVKDIHTKTLSGAPVTVMCDPTMVRSSLLDAFRRWVGLSLILHIIDLDRRGSNAGMALSSQHELHGRCSTCCLRA